MYSAKVVLNLHGITMVIVFFFSLSLQEVIVRKCNVVCTSKDKRNPQPSDRELKMADYIFYRTFDVGTLSISDKIENRTAAIDGMQISVATTLVVLN